MSVTTTNDRFPVIDITHKPKRTQAENLRNSGRAISDEAEDVSVKNTVVPQSPTVERAIKYFEDNAIGDYKVLYLNTAKWLRKYLTIKAKQLPKNLQAILPDETKEVIASEDSPTIEEK